MTSVHNNSDTIFSYIMSKYFSPPKNYLVLINIKTTHSKSLMEINSLTKTPLFELQNPLNLLKFIYLSFHIIIRRETISLISLGFSSSSHFAIYLVSGTRLWVSSISDHIAERLLHCGLPIVSYE